MEQTISIPTPAAPDFSIYGLVMHSDPVVKGVLVLLLLASVACWAIIIEKTFRLMVLKRQLRWLREAESGQGVPPFDERSGARHSACGSGRGQGTSRPR